MDAVCWLVLVFGIRGFIRLGAGFLVGLNLVSGIGLLRVLATACWCGFLFICYIGFEVGLGNYCLGLVI